MLYPFTFLPVYKNYLWGGRSLSAFGKHLPDRGIVAESWEISSHPDGESIVANGEFKGQTLTSLVKRFGAQLVGNALPPEKIIKFPLLVKFIDAKDKLSVQVHPNDEFAFNNENGGLGKNEMWYIMEASPNSKIVYDVTPGTTRESFELAVAEGRINDCLNYFPVKAGDFVDIPAGLLHAIGDGIVLAEIQQNSNTTYRVYDYDRTDAQGNTRDLHIKKALDVIDFDTSSHVGVVSGQENQEIKKFEQSESFTKTNLVSNDYFGVEKLEIRGSISEDADGSRFFIYVILEGSGKIVYTSNGNADGVLDSSTNSSTDSSTNSTIAINNLSVALQQGTSILIPATLGKYEIIGSLTALKAYVPKV